jgi:hypothetical protein
MVFVLHTSNVELPTVRRPRDSSVLCSIAIYVLQTVHELTTEDGKPSIQIVL